MSERDISGVQLVWTGREAIITLQVVGAAHGRAGCAFNTHDSAAWLGSPATCFVELEATRLFVYFVGGRAVARKMRRPRIELGSQAWKAWMITITLTALCNPVARANGRPPGRFTRTTVS